MEDLIELLDCIKNADEEAFKQFFELYVKKVYNFLFKHLQDKLEAEDLTQIVFMKIWNNRASIDLKKSIDAYVFTIAYHLVIDFYRHNNKHLKVDFSSDQLKEHPTSNLTAEDSLNKHHFESIYQTALETLPPKRKEIFLMSRHMGMSNKQIADKLQISIKTVENQMTAALKSLKDYFNQTELVFLILSLNFFFIE